MMISSAINMKVTCILKYWIVFIMSIPGGFTPQFRRLETGVPM